MEKMVYRMCFISLFTAAAAAAIAAAASAGRAADAYGAPLLFLDDVSDGSAQNDGHRCNDDYICHIASFRVLFAQCGFSFSVCLADQRYNDSHDGSNHDQTGQEACAEAAGGDQRANLIYQICRGVAGCN